ncbi:hypothetical protein [Streptomyces sp. CoH17]|uniref:hypothetical protein n=1 Tax=Streptomyces sp. CoH17 TaxID=2992806 RepID=UPI0022722670|nr:hypothetical protein [Streptomyces sp. CoH17]
MVKYRSPNKSEPTRQKGQVVNCDNEKNIAVLVTSQGGTLTVDLSVTSGPVVVYPKVGEEWYVSLLNGVWVLDRRSPVQNTALAEETEVGDHVWRNDNGTIMIRDKHGPLLPARFGTVQTRTPGTQTKQVQLLNPDGTLIGWISLTN